MWPELTQNSYDALLHYSRDTTKNGVLVKVPPSWRWLWKSIFVCSEQDIGPSVYRLSTSCQSTYHLMSGGRPTVLFSRAWILAAGRGRRSIDVVYHQNGTANRIMSGNDSTTRSRFLTVGLILAVTSGGVSLADARGFLTPAFSILRPVILQVAERITNEESTSEQRRVLFS